MCICVTVSPESRHSKLVKSSSLQCVNDENVNNTRHLRLLI